MPYFKTPNNALHFLDDGIIPGDVFGFPSEVVEITDEEVAAIRAANVPQPTIREQIAALEATITSRRLREAVLSGDHTFVQSVDAQIAALRAQL